MINEEDIFLRRLDETSEKNDLESSSATYAFLSETDNKNYKINMAGNSHDVYVVNRRGEVIVAGINPQGTNSLPDFSKFRNMEFLDVSGLTSEVGSLDLRLNNKLQDLRVLVRKIDEIYLPIEGLLNRILVASENRKNRARIYNLYQSSNLKYLRLRGGIKIDGIPNENLEVLNLANYRGELKDEHCGINNLIFLSLPSIKGLTNCDYSINTKLEYLYMNKVDSVIGIKLPNELVTLLLSGVKSDDLGFLSENIALENLYLLDTEIKSLNGIESLTNLTRLEVRESEIDSLKPISGLKNLREVNIFGSNVSTLSELSKLVNLEELYLDDAKITSISGISNLTNLKELSLYNNPIQEIDVSTLSNLKYCTVYLNTNTPALKKYTNLDNALYQLSSKGTLPPLQ
ncbi:leucine-rich repeat domain-containing protein [Thaumasiovibrio subtropicus]|uniref:leucine-rich repeat domain-containing protein n=2 Tax=Thaumasiovibrio subtropicus TaxID=1891207 RepID=UPI001C86510B|nr:leucine-rich repeat domain-containing protein [Thaumasiovibrio subtropicus]